MMLYKLPLVLDPQPEGGYVVTCPLVPDLLTEGDTVEEAVHNANDALEAVIEGYEALGRPLPPTLQPAQENARLQDDLRRRLEAVEVVSMEVDEPQPSHPMLRFAGVFKDDPLLDDVMEEIAAYRREVDAGEGAP